MVGKIKLPLLEKRHQSIKSKSLLAQIEEVKAFILTPARIIQQLAVNLDPEFRMSIADNKNTTTEVLNILSEDDNPDVRFALSENHNLDQNILQKLSSDSNPYVADRAKKTLLRINNSNTTTISNSPPTEEVERVISKREKHTNLMQANLVKGLFHLAQVLETQGKFVEGLKIRIKIRDLLISIAKAI